jgi:hypothetical protein
VARELVPDTLARAFAPAVTIHLLALAADPGSTGAIRALMTEVGTPLTTAMNTAAGAFLAARQGDRIRSAEGFARAIAAGGRSVDPMRDLTTIGRLAEEVDDRDSAIAAYEALLNRPEAVPVAAAALGRLLPATGDYLRRFHLLSRLHEFMPGSREVACEYGYLALVLGKDVRNVTALFQRFHDLGPEDRTARAGLVLALSVSGKGDAALGLAEGAGFSFEGLGKRERFIYVMSLAAAQQRGAALTLANRIPMESLQPEERALLERHLKILEAPGGRALE